MSSQTSFLSSPFSRVIVFSVSHFSHFAPKSDMFQKACGVRKFSSPHFLHEYTTIKRIFGLYLFNDVNISDTQRLSVNVINAFTFRKNVTLLSFSQYLQYPLSLSNSGFSSSSPSSSAFFSS